MSKSLALTTPTVVPPPTKRELLLATATALSVEHNKKVVEQEKVVTALVQSRDKKLTKLARQVWGTAEIMTRSWNGKDYEVIFTVKIPRSTVTDLDEQIKVAACGRRKTPEDFLIALREADTTTDDRVSAMLAIESVRKQLLSAGQKILGVAEAKKPAIEA